MDYVCGFLFSEDRTKVLLVNKLKPDWQRGKLNGIGGKIEKNEGSYQAMVREFEEETGLHIVDWKCLTTLNVQSSQINLTEWRVNFFYGFSDEVPDRVVNDVQEPLVRVNVDDLKGFQRVSNLDWLIPLCLSKDDLFVKGGMLLLRMHFPFITEYTTEF